MRILTLNSGSSSIKFALYGFAPGETLTLAGKLERIGLDEGHFVARDADGATLVEQQLGLPDHDSALQALFGWLERWTEGAALDAVGHRVVHCGSKYSRPAPVSEELISFLTDLIPIDPDHLPHEIKAIEAARRAYPALPQVACFDTAFHAAMPTVARRFGLPRGLFDEGVARHGFHGLSYEYILQALENEAGREATHGRVIVAHLGNGASMAAARDGKSVDTTMGFTPTGGLVMSTRSGDLDPGVLLYLLQEKGLSPANVNEMVNKQSGLLGVSEISSDMRDLLARESADPRAAEAIALFCYQAKKFLGALAVVLGGLDTLVFTAGIGENAPSIRWRICQGLDFLGIHLDPVRNDANAAIISHDDSPVTVRVMKTNEELMIARQTLAQMTNDQ